MLGCAHVGYRERQTLGRPWALRSTYRSRTARTLRAIPWTGILRSVPWIGIPRAIPRLAVYNNLLFIVAPLLGRIDVRHPAPGEEPDDEQKKRYAELTTPSEHRCDS